MLWLIVLCLDHQLCTGIDIALLFIAVIIIIIIAWCRLRQAAHCAATVDMAGNINFIIGVFLLLSELRPRIRISHKF